MTDEAYSGTDLNGSGALKNSVTAAVGTAVCNKLTFPNKNKMLFEGQGDKSGDLWCEQDRRKPETN
jgi:hypothetical protein